MIISLYSYQLEYTTYFALFTFALYRYFFIYGGQYTHDRTIYVIHAHFSYLLQKMGRGDFDYTLIIHNNFVMHLNVLLENIIAFVSLNPFLNSLFSFRRIAALPCIQLNFYVTEIQRSKWREIFLVRLNSGRRSQSRNITMGFVINFLP